MKQILCVRFVQWPIDRIKRKQERKPARVASATLIDKSQTPGFKSKSNPESQISKKIQAIPAALVLVRTVASRQLVVFACGKARAAGIDPGMTLAEAGALCAGLVHLDHDPQKDLQGLHRLARWMVRFSPVVAVEPPDALFLDLTGSERLFHGLDRLAELIHQGLTRLGLHFQMAIADTPGAAWALAEGKRSTSNAQLSTFNEEFAEASPALESWRLNVESCKFAQLPIAALRLEPDQILAFHNLGIQTIKQLMQLPRETLPARFGHRVLHRLDQALGKIPEPLVPIPHSQPIRAKMEFEGGVESLGDLWQAFKFLLEQIVQELRLRGCGARQLVAEFDLPGEEPIVKTIGLSRPTANLSTLWNLLRCTTETVKCGQDGFCGLKLSVPFFSRLSAEQLHLLDQQSQLAAGELDRLIERLRVRLGDGVVLFPEAVESHLPEKAVCYLPDKSERSTSSIQRPPKNEKRDLSSLSLRSWTLDAGRSTLGLIPCINAPVPKKHDKPRPLHLLPDPVEVQCSSLASDLDQRLPISFTHTGQVHPLVHCNGPERITGSWWEGRNKTRDYFEVEDRSGQRFWLFRVDETRRWYLHGIFDL